MDGEVDFNAHAETYTADPHVSQFGQLACDNLNAEFPSIVPVGSGTCALDFGTGGGNVAFRLSSQGTGTVVALDPAENMIKVVKRQISEQQIQGVTPFLGTCDEYSSACSRVEDEAMPKAFDLITASSVLGFVNDKLGTLKCLGKMLRGSGSHIVHWDWLANNDDESSGGFTLEGVRKLHADCGLDTVFSDVCFTFMGMDVVLGIAKRV